MASACGDAAMLVTAAEGDGPLVGAALNLVGSEAIFGRNWGCSRFVPALHFEVCYYQAIEEAIQSKLRRVEAGAQGEHKVQRGYLPTLTHSGHYLADERLRQAVAQFVAAEADAARTCQPSPPQWGPFGAP